MVNIIFRQVLICSNTILSIFQDMLNYCMLLKLRRDANSCIMELDV